MVGSKSREEATADFDERVRPSLRYATRVGSNYSASNFIGLCGLIDGARERIRAGDRIGLFPYGSGAIGQFYSGLVLPEAMETVAAMRIDEAMEARRRLSVTEYELLEKMRDEAAEADEFAPPLDIPQGWYDAHYRGKRRLILKGISQFKRQYEWS
jgi:3-hydroxy-3-methylglutaryl CoA synthase